MSFDVLSYGSKSDDMSISIITPSWKNWTNEDGTGFYFDLVNLIYGPLNYKINITFTPFARAFKMIELKKSDLMFSLYSRDEKSEVLTSQYPIDAGTILIIFDRKLSWEGISSLNKQNVIIPRAYNFDKFIKEDITFMEIKNSKQGMAMFLHGRAPYFATHYVEMLELQNIHDIDPTKYRVEILQQKDLHIGYANTSKGKILRKIFDQKMPILIQNGQIEELYKKWNVEQLVNFKVNTPIK